MVMPMLNQYSGFWKYNFQNQPSSASLEPDDGDDDGDDDVDLPRPPWSRLQELALLQHQVPPPAPSLDPPFHIFNLFNF